MQRTVKTTLFVIVFVLFTFSGAAEDAENAKRSERAEVTAQKRRQEIRAEIKSLGNHPWAGEYYHGDGLAVNVSLAIAPKSGYVYEWHSCSGLHDRNYGPVEWKNGCLHLSFTFEYEREGFPGIAEELIPVAWGARKYLVSADGFFNNVVGFCNDVNRGSEPRTDIHGGCLLRRGDEKKKVTGLPTVPPEYQPYLLKQPITAEIIAVGSRATRSSVSPFTETTDTVTVSAGRKDGLLPGMKLYLTASDGLDSADITTVAEEKAEGIITRTFIFIPHSRPKVGWKLSTRDPFYERLLEERDKEPAKE